MTQPDNQPEAERHLRTVDSALRRADRLDQDGAAPDIAPLPESFDPDSPNSGKVPNQPATDEEQAARQAFEAGVDAADDEAFTAGEAVRDPLDR